MNKRTQVVQDLKIAELIRRNRQATARAEDAIDLLEALPNVTTRTGNYSIQADDFIILGNAAVQNITLTLPAPVQGRLYYIKKISDNAFTVTINPNASETIDGDSSLVINVPYASVLIMSDGTNWYIF